LTTNNQDPSGYAGGAAQIPHVNAINDKSHPNSSTNINASAVTLEALPKFHRQTQLKTCIVPIQQQTSTILQVTPEALPNFIM